MNDKDLIKALRENADWAFANEWETPITLGDNLNAAADRIERLADENAQLKAERDAAIEAVRALTHDMECCDYCKYQGDEKRAECGNVGCWTWRGAKGEDND